MYWYNRVSMAAVESSKNLFIVQRCESGVKVKWQISSPIPLNLWSIFFLNLKTVLLTVSKVIFRYNKLISLNWACPLILKTFHLSPKSSLLEWNQIKTTRNTRAKPPNLRSMKNQRVYEHAGRVALLSLHPFIIKQHQVRLEFVAI